MVVPSLNTCVVFELDRFDSSTLRSNRTSPRRTLPRLFPVARGVDGKIIVQVGLATLALDDSACISAELPQLACLADEKRLCWIYMSSRRVFCAFLRRCWSEHIGSSATWQPWRLRTASPSLHFTTECRASVASFSLNKIISHANLPYADCRVYDRGCIPGK